MDHSLVENIEVQEVACQADTSWDLSLIGKGKEFKKLYSHVASLIILFIVVSQCIVTVLVFMNVITFELNLEPIKTSYFLPFHFLLVLQSFCWVVIALLDRFVHHLAGKHKKQGYVSFYTHTKFIRRLPAYVMSAGCATCLLLGGLWGDTRPPYHGVTPRTFMVVVSALQTIIILPAVIYYASVVSAFNKSRRLPDMQSYLKDSASPFQIQVGLQRSKQELETTIDKQAEIIQSLQHHNQVLARRIMSLHRQIKA